MYSDLLALKKQLRTRNSVPIVFSLLIGFTFSQNNFESSKLFLCAVSLIFIYFYTTLNNDITDYDIDKHGKRDSPLLSNKFNKKKLSVFLNIFIILGLVFAVLTLDFYIMSLVLIFVFLSYGYNTKPFVFSRKPISSILSLSLILGGIPVTIGLYIGERNLDILSLILIVSVAIHRFSVSVLKDYKDYEDDKLYDKNTFLIVYGAKKTKITSLAFSAIGYVLFIILCFMKINSSIDFVLLIPLFILMAFSLLLRIRFSDRNRNFNINKSLFYGVFEVSLMIDLMVIICFYT